MPEASWHALRELLALRARFDEFFERALLPASPLSAAGAVGATEPPVDIWEDERHLVVEVEVPGVAASDLELRLEGDELVLAGTTVLADPPGCSYLRVERPRGPLRRRVRLPVPVTGEPRAALSGGVLTVTMERASPLRRIPVVHEGASQ